MTAMAATTATATTATTTSAPPFPRLAPLTGADTSSFAHVTIKDRLPVILTQLIDHLCRFEHGFAMIKLNGNAAPPRECESESDSVSSRARLIQAQTKLVVAHISRLRYEMQCNKRLAMLQDRVEDDCAGWNDHLLSVLGEDLAQNGVAVAPNGVATATNTMKTGHWFSVPWLLAECYMYRRVREAFLLVDAMHKETLGMWSWSRDYDWFAAQKEESFRGALKDIDKAAQVLETTITDATQGHVDSSAFTTLLHAALWGNQIDLSMHAGKTADEIAMTHRHSDMHGAPTNLDEFLLVDDTLAVWRHLQAALANANTSASPLTITFILDNAGAELFMDLCLADYLTTIARVTHIRLHHKSFPWFVSDVVRSDVEWMLQQMEVHGAALQSTAARWRNHFATGAWSLHSHSFWTTAHAFRAMPAIAPDLFAELRASALVVVKGDLNYRKLVGDLQYPPPFTMPFDVALRYDARSGLPCDVANCNVSDMSQLPLVALRTCKADVVVGLGDPSIAERLDREVGVNCDGKGWLVTGKYAVIQATSVVHGGSERRYDSENGVE